MANGSNDGPRTCTTVFIASLVVIFFIGIIVVIILGSGCPPDKCTTNEECGTNTDPCFSQQCSVGAGAGPACSTTGCRSVRNETDSNCQLPDLPTSGSGLSPEFRIVGIILLIIIVPLIVLCCIAVISESNSGGLLDSRIQTLAGGQHRTSQQALVFHKSR